MFDCGGTKLKTRSPSSPNLASKGGHHLGAKNVRKFLLVIGSILAATSLASAQGNADVGVFLDYLQISQTSTPNVGIGGRFGYHILPYTDVEGEVAYDYGFSFNEVLTNLSTGLIQTVERTSIGTTHGLFGVKLQHKTGTGIHPFATAKVGFVDFRLAPSLIPFVDVVSPILGIRTQTLNAATYFGGGLEGNISHFGVRLDLGDEIYFNNGAHNNFRLTFGPHVLF